MNKRTRKATQSPPPSPRPTQEAILADLDLRLALIQALIPLGLEAVEGLLQEEVLRLAGPRYDRKAADQPYRRWGRQPGSVYLADQKLPVQVPRVRNVATATEVPLHTYQELQTPRQGDDGLMLRVLKGIACRQYEACAEAVPPAFGLSPSTVSRRFIQATARKLQQFQDRSLVDYDLVAVVLDGKTFADEEMLIALGITLEGDKVLLGFTQTVTENERVCRQFLRSLLDRGLRYEHGLLVLVDGAKGLYNAVTQALDGYVRVQRCQWHKRENVLSYLAPSEQARVRRALKQAYDQETYDQAKAALDTLKPQLAQHNQSALASLEEGLEETLTLHRLGMMPYLKQSFRTTNLLESVNSQVSELTDHVKHWTNSGQRQRWLAAALLDIEPRLRKVKGVPYLPMLRRALQQDLGLTVQPQVAQQA